MVALDVLKGGWDVIRLLAASGFLAVMAGAALGQGSGASTDLRAQDGTSAPVDDIAAAEDIAAAPAAQGGAMRTDPPADQARTAPSPGSGPAAAQETEPAPQPDVAAAGTGEPEQNMDARLAELRRQAAEAEARLADLAQQLDGLVVQRDQVRDEVAALEARRSEAEAALALAQQQEATLRQVVEETTARQAAAEAAALDAERRQAEAEQGFAEAQELRDLAEAALAETAGELDQMTAIRSPVQQEPALPAASGPQEDAEAPPPQGTVAATSQQPGRPAAKVDGALSRAPALGTGPQRADLRRRLIAGECAPEALRGAYGQINRQTLLALVAELGACS